MFIIWFWSPGLDRGIIVHLWATGEDILVQLFSMIESIVSVSESIFKDFLETFERFFAF